MGFGIFGKKDIVHIVGLYEEHCGTDRSFHDATYSNPTGMLKDLKRGEWEFRLGSRWTDLSKLIMHYAFFRKNVRVKFDLNPDSSVNEQARSEAEEARLEFETEARNYLGSK